MIYVIATFLYFMMAFMSKGLIVNMHKKENDSDVVLGCFSFTAILSITAIKIWLIGLGLTQLGIWL